MASTQLSFSVRVSSGVKTVHLLGSWDNYVGQLPLSKDKTASKSGTWKGVFRFNGGSVEPGQRYWYYYIIDGYHVSHNPSEPSTVEPTTGRELNILDVPKAKSSSSKSSSSSSSSSSSHKSSSRHSSSSSKSSSSSSKSSSSSSKSSKSSSSKSSSSSSKPGRPSIDIPKGRPLSVSQIKSPMPVSPHATSKLVNFDEEELSNRFGAICVRDDDDYEYDEVIEEEFDSRYLSSPDSSGNSSSDLSYRSDSSSPGSQTSGYSTPASDSSSCTCELYGITRKGDRLRLDCGGTRCGYVDSCSSSEDEAEYVPTSSRRHGIVVRN
ncbi:hypothetical protein VTK73DRAFT_1062 [Phialemonium thermophilum]|uniref:SRP40 Suppressor of mutant AC40 of RNA polymerase I and III n=1 Tax=Phialemonium thermophilum TaxID=223376 RepID=A0ABR3VTX4_9PEZI